MPFPPATTFPISSPARKTVTVLPPSAVPVNARAELWVIPSVDETPVSPPIPVIVGALGAVVSIVISSVDDEPLVSPSIVSLAVMKCHLSLNRSMGMME